MSAIASCVAPSLVTAGGKLRKARGLAHDETVQRERLRVSAACRMSAGEPAQDFREIRSGDERHGRRRPAILR